MQRSLKKILQSFEATAKELCMRQMAINILPDPVRNYWRVLSLWRFVSTTKKKSLPYFERSKICGSRRKLLTVIKWWSVDWIPFEKEAKKWHVSLPKRILILSYYFRIWWIMGFAPTIEIDSEHSANSRERPNYICDSLHVTGILRQRWTRNSASCREHPKYETHSLHVATLLYTLQIRGYSIQLPHG